MTSNWLRSFVCLAALVVAASFVSDASAFCSTCGGGGGAYYAPQSYSAAYAPAYTSWYAPTYTTAYAPASYTANYGSGSGWFPGCCLGRLFGWRANYAPTYAVSYAPVCSTCSTCAAPCSTCTTCANFAPCSSCVQQVTMRPVCTTACAQSCGCSDCSASCSSCAGCPACGGAAVSQTSYQESSGCASCGQTVPASSAVVVPSQPQMVVPNAVSSGSSTPELAPSEQVGPRTFQKPPSESGAAPQPGPANDTEPTGTAPKNGGTDATKTDSNANYFEAPKLFSPNDRTAARVAAPVRNAIYEKPASYRPVSTGRITAAQAQQDAAGWTSASH